MNRLERLWEKVFNPTNKSFLTKRYLKTHYQQQLGFNRTNLKRIIVTLPLFFRMSRNISICIASSIIPHAKLNVEDDLRKAVEEGETAIVELMNELRDLVLTVSKEYRTCLTQQIELLKTMGDEAYEKLPKFRTLASQLSNELDEYLVLLKTIGEIAYEQTMLSLMVDKNGLETILKKYKELEIVLLHEFEENKRKELELLEANIANIVSG